jgi:hypothetical protein
VVVHSFVGDDEELRREATVDLELRVRAWGRWRRTMLWWAKP